MTLKEHRDLLLPTIGLTYFHYSSVQLFNSMRYEGEDFMSCP